MEQVSSSEISVTADDTVSYPEKLESSKMSCTLQYCSVQSHSSGRLMEVLPVWSSQDSVDEATSNAV